MKPHSLKTWFVLLTGVSALFSSAALVGCLGDEPASEPFSEEPAELPAFEVVNEETYRALLAAGTSVEVLRTELGANPNSRIVASAVLLMAFAEANRYATKNQLLAYAEGVDELLASAFSTDPNLLRSVHFLPAVRFLSEGLDLPALEGTNINVGQRALKLLQLDLNVSSRSLRAVDFERAQALDFSNYSPFADLAVLLLLDQKTNATGHLGLAEAFKALASRHGLDLTPAALQAEHPDIALAVARLPADFEAYEAEQSAGFGATKTFVTDEFSTVQARIDDSLAELKQGLLEETDFFVAADNATDPVLANVLLERAKEARRARSASRAALALGTLVMSQSDDGAEREFSRQARTFADAQLEAEGAMSVASGILQVAGAVAFGGGLFKTGDKIGAVGAMLVAAGGVLGLVDPGATSPDTQIFDQIVELRRQVEEMRVEMHARFDSIDAQLNSIFEGISLGFNQLNETTLRIDANVQQLSIDLYTLRSSLSALEANLYGVLSAGFEQSFVEDMETGLGYRGRTGTDLEFVGQGENNFFAFHSRFFARATSSAADEVYAGPVNTTLVNDASAANVLGGFPLGYNINNLRAFPQQLGLPALGLGRVANPTTWSLAADAYAQLARENPWYFAKLNQNDPARLDGVIAAGESVQAMMAQARSRALFEALVDGYRGRVEALDLILGLEYYLDANDYPPQLDPFIGLDRDMQNQGPAIDTVGNVFGEDLPVWFDPALFWELFDSKVGLAAASKLPNWTESRWLYRYGGRSTGFVTPQAQLDFRLLDTLGGNDYSHFATIYFDFVGDQLETRDDIEDWLEANGSIMEELARATTEDEQFSAGGFTVVYRGRDIVHEPTLIPAAVAVQNQLDLIADEYWSHIEGQLSSSTVLDLFEALKGSQLLLEAYSGLGLPETLEQNDLVRAILRGAASEESGLSGAWVTTAFSAALVAGTHPPEFKERLLGRADVLLEQLGPELDKAEPEVHAYLLWSLESLRAIKENTLDLCNGDSYTMTSGTTLLVNANRGVFTNDAQQPGASSVSVALVSSPQNGTIALGADGSFKYQVNPGFVGMDSFVYSATAVLDQDDGTPNQVTSAEQTVTIVVEDKR